MNLELYNTVIVLVVVFASLQILNLVYRNFRRKNRHETIQKKGFSYNTLIIPSIFFAVCSVVIAGVLQFNNAVCTQVYEGSEINECISVTNDSWLPVLSIMIICTLVPLIIAFSLRLTKHWKIFE